MMDTTPRDCTVTGGARRAPALMRVRFRSGPAIPAPALPAAPLPPPAPPPRARDAAVVPTFGTAARLQRGAVLMTRPASAPVPRALAFVAGSLALSFILFPSSREQALMHLQAGRADRANELLELSLRSGDHSPFNVSALARLRAASGNVKGAVELLTDPLNVRPDDPSVLRVLAGYYRTLAMPEERLQTLERLQALAPEPEDLRALATLYGELGMQERQRGALRQLVMNSEAVVGPGDYIALARLLIEQEPATAADVLERLSVNHPEALDVSVVAMRMSALRAAGRIAAAVEAGRHWIEALPGRAGPAAKPFAEALLPGQRYTLVANFLAPYAAPDDADPTVVAVWAQAQIDAGDPAKALERLQRAAARDIANPESRLLHVRLALALGAFDDALVNARRLGLSKLPSADFTTLCAAALERQRLDVLREALASTSGEALGVNPLVAARVQLALGNTTAARRWSVAAESFVGTDLLLNLQLARVRQRLDDAAGALVSLRRATSAQALQETLLAEVARLYIALGAPAEGRKLLERLRGDMPSSAVDEAWALTAASSGREREVIAWLRDPSRPEAGAEYYRDLAYVAMEAHVRSLAVEAALRLAALSSTAGDRLLVANALLAGNRAAEALPYLRNLPRATAQERATYAFALMAAWRKGQPVAEELRGLWVEKLAEARAPKQRDEAVAVLIEMRAYDAVLPMLAELAAEEPQRWLGAYADIATRAGRKALLPTLWSRVGENTATPRPVREQVLFRLLETGSKAPAERIARDLAETAAPDDVALRRLLHLWGPRPTAEQLEWLESRARGAAEAERGAWWLHLVRAGAARRVLALHAALPAGTADAVDASVQDAYLEAMRVVGDKPAIEQAVRQALHSGQVRGAREWRQWAGLADYLGQPDLRRRTLRSLAAAGAANAETHRTLGLLAHDANDLSEAERELAAYEAATGGDLQSHLLLGEIQAKRGATDAQPHFARALEMLEAQAEPGFEQRLAKAKLLLRLKRESDAIPLYAALLAERSNDKNLRADYASLLLSLGRLDDARAVLVTQ